MTNVLEVEVTCPDADVARDIAQAALTARLVACANILPDVQSLFHWQGQIDSESEALLRMKAPARHFDALCALVAAHHPYDLPAITAFDLTRLGPGVADWVTRECQLAKT